MKTFLIECLIPQGSLLRFISNEFEGEGKAQAGYDHFKEIKAKQIKVYEKKEVTDDFR